MLRIKIKRLKSLTDLTNAINGERRNENVTARISMSITKQEERREQREANRLKNADTKQRHENRGAHVQNALHPNSELNKFVKG